MTNNYFLRRTGIIFGYDLDKMVEIFNHAGIEVSKSKVRAWARKDDDPEIAQLPDQILASFLNGFIILNRGKKDGVIPEPEKVMNNNIILRKFKIALTLKDEDIIDLFKRSGFDLGKAELSSFFRNTSHKNYRMCKDQFLRNFFHGLQEKHYEGPLQAPPQGEKRYTKKDIPD